MKTSRIFLIFSLLILAGALLSGCAGGASPTSSWPGVSADGDTAYLSFGQHVYAVNLTTGAEKWRFPAQAENKVIFYAPAAVTSDELVVGSFNHAVYSIGKDGQQKWVYTGPKNTFIAQALAEDNSIYVPSTDERLYALTPAGALQWTFDTAHALWATPVTDGNTVYQASMDHFVYALDRASGRQLWKSEDLGGAIVGTPTLSPDGVLYVGSFGNKVVALDAKSGKELNRYSTSGWVWSAPALNDGVLYFGDLNGFIYAVKADDFSEVWKVQPDTTSPRKAVAAKPLVQNGVVFVPSENGTLYALDAATGNTTWMKTLGGELYGNPVAAGDLILVTGLKTEAPLIALDQSGNEKWKFIPAK